MEADEPFRFRNQAKTEQLKKVSKYSELKQWASGLGSNLDKIEYPAAFGPKGELLGIACACDIAQGETILSMPCSARIDFGTIMSSELGPFIKALGVEHDEELVMALYIMRQRTLGPLSPLYHSMQTATPPDLAMGWSEEEIAKLQDRTTIDYVHRMRKHIEGIFSHLYERFLACDSLAQFVPVASWTKEQVREFFLESFQSAATRYIQYEFHLKYMTYMPFIECSNYTPDKLPPLYQCIDKEGGVVTQCNLGYPMCYGIPGLEAHLGRPFSEVKNELSKVVSEKDLDMVDD